MPKHQVLSLRFMLLDLVPTQSCQNFNFCMWLLLLMTCTVWDNMQLKLFLYFYSKTLLRTIISSTHLNGPMMPSTLHSILLIFFFLKKFLQDHMVNLVKVATAGTVTTAAAALMNQPTPGGLAVITSLIKVLL